MEAISDFCYQRFSFIFLDFFFDSEILVGFVKGRFYTIKIKLFFVFR